MKFNKKVSLKTEERKFVGANVSQHTSSYLSLYALGLQVSKSSLIADAIGVWQNSNEIAMPEHLLINSVVDIAKEQFLNDKPKKGEPAFKIRLQHELHKKGIELRVINLIIKRFNDETK